MRALRWPDAWPERDVALTQALGLPEHHVVKVEAGVEPAEAGGTVGEVVATPQDPRATVVRRVRDRDVRGDRHQRRVFLLCCWLVAL